MILNPAKTRIVVAGWWMVDVKIIAVKPNCTAEREQYDALEKKVKNLSMLKIKEIWFLRNLRELRKSFNKQKIDWKSVDKIKNNDNANKPIKYWMKLFIYFVLFCVAVYGLLWCFAYWELENYKMDMDDMMSFDNFDTVSQK